MAFYSVSIEYHQGKPAWKFQTRDPEAFLNLDYTIQFKLFPFPQGALLATHLCLHGQEPYHVHRLYDISDPIARNYLTKMIQYGHLELVIEKIPDQSFPGLESRELFPQTLDFSREVLQEILEEGKKLNQNNPDLYGLEGVELFLEAMENHLQTMSVEEGWQKVEETFCGPRAKKKEEDSPPSSPPTPLGLDGGAKGYTPGPPMGVGGGRRSAPLLGKMGGVVNPAAPPSPIPSLSAPATSINLPPGPVIDTLSSTSDQPIDRKDTLTRQTTVRYFDRMYSFHTYPLRVVISQGKIQEISIAGVAQSVGDQPFRLSAQNPYVTLVPIFPGALVIPETLEVDVTPNLVETEFWITPQTEGNLEMARVEIHHQGRVIDTVSTPYQVTKHTLAKVVLFFSVVFPLLGPLLRSKKWDLESQIASGFPLLKPMFDLVKATPLLAGFVILAGLAGLLYWWKKPKEADPISQLISLTALLEGSTKGPSGQCMSKTQADDLHDKGIGLLQDGALSQAIECFETVLPAYRKLAVSYDYGILLCNLGVAYLDKEDFSSALEIYAEELSVWTRLGYEKERGRCLSNLGVLYQSLENYPRAAIFLQEAMAIRQQAGDREGQIYSAKLLAQVYKKMGQCQESLRIYTGVADQLKDNREKYAGILQLRGVTSASFQQYNEAIRDYEEALEIFQSLGFQREQADLIFNMGLAYQGQGDKTKALETFHSALEMSYQALECGDQIPQEDMDEIREFIRKLEQD